MILHRELVQFEQETCQGATRVGVVARPIVITTQIHRPFSQHCRRFRGEVFTQAERGAHTVTQEFRPKPKCSTEAMRGCWEACQIAHVYGLQHEYRNLSARRSLVDKLLHGFWEIFRCSQRPRVQFLTVSALGSVTSF